MLPLPRGKEALLNLVRQLWETETSQNIREHFSSCSLGLGCFFLLHCLFLFVFKRDHPSLILCKTILDDLCLFVIEMNDNLKGGVSGQHFQEH